MRNWHRCLMFVAALGLSAEAQAQSALTYYDCDTSAGHFSSVLLDLGEGQTSISGVVRLVRAFRNRQWSPIAGVAIRDGRNEARLSLSATRVVPEALRTKDDAVIAGVIFNSLMSAGPLDASKAGTPISEIELGSSVAFTLTFNGNKVDYQIGGQSGSINIELVGKLEVMLSCSTGQFKFEQLKQQ